MIARVFVPGLLLMLSNGMVQSEQDYDPNAVDVVDAINCNLDARQYTGFSVTLGDEDSGFRKRGWKKQESGNPFLSQYLLPSPISVAGHKTKTIVFSANAVLAVLDIANPGQLAARENIQNSYLGADKFLGEREMINKIEKDKETGWTMTTRITRNISTVSSHPGKTLLGCSYNMNVNLPGHE